VKLVVIRSGINMRESTNQSLQELSEQLDKRCSEYAKSLGIPWPATLDNVNEARRNLRRRETERWERLSSQGQGVRDFRSDKIGNAWLRNPELLKPSRHIDALKLRITTVGSLLGWGAVTALRSS
jgi:hypothetical protein